MARVLAEEDVDALFIEHQWQLQGVVSDIGLLVRLLPGYILEDPTLAQVLEEGAATCSGSAWKATPPQSCCPPSAPGSPRSTVTPP